MDISTTRKVRIVILVAILVLCLLAKLMLSGGNPTLSFIFVIMGIALLFAHIVIGIVFWRCPHCRRLLPEKTYRIEFCPRCGMPLE